jgi:nicotinamide-nucleotide amidase
MKAAIIAVGTELTTGQVLNRNASWISQELKAMGLITALHLSIPDERQLILDALKFASDRAEILFITGGLGPTSDDFTRELVSQWCKTPLEFDEGSWQHIKDRLSARNYPVKEIQKQQCYFPSGAHILKNSEGTANGFIMSVQGKTLFVLPGPPREIAALFKDFIIADLKALTVGLDRHETISWETIGLGESQIAEKVETLVKDSGFEIGYRAHMPYVEVKISFFNSEKDRALPYIKKIDEVLAPLTLVKGNEDIVGFFIQKLSRFHRIEIMDSFTGSILHERFFLTAQKILKNKEWSYSTQKFLSAPALGALRLSLTPTDDLKALASIEYLDQRSQLIIENTSSDPERQFQIVTEYAMLYWSQQLSKN